MECLCTSASIRFKGVDVAKALEGVFEAHGVPESIKVDNGPEFISKEDRFFAFRMDQKWGLAQKFRRVNIRWERKMVDWTGFLSLALIVFWIQEIGNFIGLCG